MNIKNATPQNEAAISSRLANTNSPDYNTAPRFSLFETHKQTKRKEVLSLDDLIERIKRPKLGPKDNAPLILPFLSDGKTKDHAQSAEHTAIVIDHDNDNRSELAIKNLYSGYGVAYVAYTTSSNQQDFKYRWKVVIPLTESVEPELIQPIKEGLTLAIKGDPSQARVTQGFYAPNRLDALTPYESIVELDKPFLDIDDQDSMIVQAAYRALENDDTEQLEAARKAPTRTHTEAVNNVFELCARYHPPEQTLLEAGYKRKDKKWLAPESESGKPGVVMFYDNEQQYVYSWHGSSDPLSASLNENHRLDAFDVYCILKHDRDTKSAVKTLLNSYDQEGQKQRQIEYMQAQEQAQLAQQPKRPDFLVSANSLLEQPKPVQWTIKGIIEHQTLAMLFGPSGSGKSYVTLSMAVSVATGRDWYDHPTKQGPVVYVAGEGHGGISRRLKALAVDGNIDLSKAPLFISRTAVAFNDITSFGSLNREMAALKTPPSLIVIDTLARAAAGIEENSATEMGKFIAQCDELKHRYGCTVILVHHTGHEEKKRARGSSAIYAALDVELHIDLGPTLKCTKMKDGPEFKDMRFTFRPVELPPPWVDEDGDPMRSAVLDFLGHPQNVRSLLSKPQKIALKALEKLGEATDEEWQEQAIKDGISKGKKASQVKAFNRSRDWLERSTRVVCNDEKWKINKDN